MPFQGHDRHKLWPFFTSEQFIGQEICSNSNFKREKLYYWARDKRGSSAEVDYMIEKTHGVIPVEVKAAPPGN